MAIKKIDVSNQTNIIYKTRALICLSTKLPINDQHLESMDSFHIVNRQLVIAPYQFIVSYLCLHLTYDLCI